MICVATQYEYNDNYDNNDKTADFFNFLAVRLLFPVPGNAARRRGTLFVRQTRASGAFL